MVSFVGLWRYGCLLLLLMVFVGQLQTVVSDAENVVVQ